MKRVFLILIVILLAALTACSGSEQQKSELTVKATGTAQGERPDGSGKSRDEMPDMHAAGSQSGSGSATQKSSKERIKDSGGAGEQSTSDGDSVLGTVKTIVGNEVTLVVSGEGKESSEKYLLPVGMSIGSKDYSSVKAGDSLKITFGTHPDDGSRIITAVTIQGNR